MFPADAKRGLANTHVQKLFLIDYNQFAHWLFKIWPSMFISMTTGQLPILDCRFLS